MLKAASNVMLGVGRLSGKGSFAYIGTCVKELPYTDTAIEKEAEISCAGIEVAVTLTTLTCLLAGIPDQHRLLRLA